ncbi:MAG: hypothetical protein WBA67_03725 [Jannaschia sp.]
MTGWKAVSAWTCLVHSDVARIGSDHERDRFRDFQGGVVGDVQASIAPVVPDGRTIMTPRIDADGDGVRDGAILLSQVPALTVEDFILEARVR